MTSFFAIFAAECAKRNVPATMIHYAIAVLFMEELIVPHVLRPCHFILDSSVTLGAEHQARFEATAHLLRKVVSSIKRPNPKHQFAMHNAPTLESIMKRLYTAKPFIGESNDMVHINWAYYIMMQLFARDINDVKMCCAAALEPTSSNLFACDMKLVKQHVAALLSCTSTLPHATIKLIRK